MLKKIAAGVVLATMIGGGAAPAAAHRLRDFREERWHIKKRARSAVGTPYRYGGSSPSGFDCSGLTRWVFLEHGADLPRTSADQFALGRRDAYKRIWSRKNLKVGDLVFHNTSGGGVGHAGIYIGRGRFISTTSSSGVAVRSVYDPYYWGPRWVGATRVPATMRYKR